MSKKYLFIICLYIFCSGSMCAMFKKMEELKKRKDDIQKSIDKLKIIDKLDSPQSSDEDSDDYGEYRRKKPKKRKKRKRQRKLKKYNESDEIMKDDDGAEKQGSNSDSNDDLNEMQNKIENSKKDKNAHGYNIKELTTSLKELSLEDSSDSFF